ncbi:MAG: hypothetical protein AAGB04_09175 [Pseudomonadota bacterium]
MTNSPTEEELMAFVDGELEPAAAANLGQQIERTVELQQRVAIYSETRNSLEKLYAGQADSPVPQRLISVISNYQPAPKTSWLGTISDRSKSFLESILGSADDFSYPRLATFAASILVAGVFVGQSLTFFQGSAETKQVVQIGPVSNSSPLKLALSTTASGKSIAWQSGDDEIQQKLNLVLTFRSKDALFCRKFTLTALNSSAISAFACLDQTTGHWRIVSAATKNNSVADASGYQTASSAQSPETTATLARLMEDIPLEAEKERQLIENKWAAK